MTVKLAAAQVDGFVLNPTTGGPADFNYGAQISQLINGNEVYITYEHVMNNGRFSFTNLKDGTYIIRAFPSAAISEKYEGSRPLQIKIVNGTYSGSPITLIPVLKAGASVTIPVLKAKISTEAAKTYFASNNGNDTTGDGTFGKPWRTIAKANSIIKAGDTLYLRGGTYRETLKPLSSGTQEKPITYAAYQNEKVIISGADAIRGWTKWSGNIYSAPLNWSLGNFNQLLLGDETLWEARWPNLQRYTVEGLKSAMAVADDGSVTTITDDAMKGLPNDIVGGKIWIRAGGNSNGLDIGMGALMPQTSVIDAYEPSIGKLNFAPLYQPGPAFTPSKNNDYYLYGKLSLLDSKNEWYIDEAAKKIYLYSDTGAAPAGVEMKRRLVDIDLSGASFIQIKGIQTLAGTINMRGSNDCLIEQSTMTWLNYAPLYDKDFKKYDDDGLVIGGNRNIIRNCTLSLTSGNGLIINGNDNVVINNLFTDITTSAGSSAAINLTGSRNLISRNTITHTGVTAIKLSGKANQIQYNDISEFMLLSADGGAIYCGGSDGDNTRVHHNRIYESQGNTIGIYFDGWTSHFCADHNVLYNIEYHPLDANAPQNFNLYYNNTFYNTNCRHIANVHWIGAYDDDWFGTSMKNNLFNIIANRPLTNIEYIFSNNIETNENNGYTAPTSGDFTLNTGSSAIDKGAVIPGITDDFTGSAPDIGAFELGQIPWTAGCDLTKTFDDVYVKPVYEGMTLLKNGCFEYFQAINTNGAVSTAISDWTVKGNCTATVESVGSNTGSNNYIWSLRGLQYRLMLRNGIVSVEQTVAGLKPNTTYELSGWSYVDDGEVIEVGVSHYGPKELSWTNNVSDSYTRCILRFTTGPADTSALIRISKTSAGKWAVRADDFTLVEAAYTENLGVGESDYVVMDAPVTASPTASKVLVNGVPITFDAYTINSNNYFKLRDLAKVVSGTSKQFEVTWDGTKNAINLISNKPYTSVGGEMAIGDGKEKSAVPNTSKIFKDGLEVALTAYTINGNNYFKLRDIGKLFDFGVNWNGPANSIEINTSKGYDG